MYSDQIHAYKKSLNIPKWQQKAVHQSTDNTMAKKTPTNNGRNVALNTTSPYIFITTVRCG
jgi:hypothetical protein